LYIFAESVRIGNKRQDIPSKVHIYLGWEGYLCLCPKKLGQAWDSIQLFGVIKNTGDQWTQLARCSKEKKGSENGMC